MTDVRFLDPEPSGLGAMLGGLIQANLERHPERRRLLRPGLVGIVATDANTAITIRLTPNLITVADGLLGRPQLVIRTDSETLTELSSVPLRFGFPDVVAPQGRATLKKLRTRHLRVKGMIAHADLLSRLNRLLTVAD